MKRLSAVTAALVLALQYGGEYRAFAHGTHYGPSERPPYTPSAQLKYRYVTPTGSDINVDFTRNPNICPNGQCPPDLKGLSLVVPRLVNELDNHETITTFQLSQGMYQDVATLNQTGGSFDYFEFLIPPEASTIYHSHVAGWELFYVLGGDPSNACKPGQTQNCLPDNDNVIFDLKADANTHFTQPDLSQPFFVVTDQDIEIQREVPRGSFVALPAGKIHTWSNVGDHPARVLALITPATIAAGFEIEGAPAGLFANGKKVARANGSGINECAVDDCTPLTNNCFSTGRGQEVDCLIPTEPDFYSFVAVGNTYVFPVEGSNPPFFPYDVDYNAPDFSRPIFGPLGFTPAPCQPSSPPDPFFGSCPQFADSRCPKVYDRSGGQINPTGNEAGDACPTTVVPAPTDPFTGTSFTNPYVLLTLGQTAGPLTPAPLAAKVFEIKNGESYSNLTSSAHETFRVLEGSVSISLGGRRELAPAGASAFIPKGRPFSLVGTTEGAKMIQFSVAVPEEN